jgi:hypothetical protein
VATPEELGQLGEALAARKRDFRTIADNATLEVLAEKNFFIQRINNGHYLYVSFRGGGSNLKSRRATAEEEQEYLGQFPPESRPVLNLKK